MRSLAINTDNANFWGFGMTSKQVMPGEMQAAAAQKTLLAITMLTSSQGSSSGHTFIPSTLEG